MAKLRPGYIGMAGFFLALDKQNPNKFKPHDVRWKLTTGRLSQEDEKAIMKHSKTGKLSDTYSETGHGFEYYEGLKSASMDELTKKGWVTKKDVSLAKRFSKK